MPNGAMTFGEFYVGMCCAVITSFLIAITVISVLVVLNWRHIARMKKARDFEVGA